MSQIEVYKGITKTVLNQYALVNKKIQFLSHSENVTFFVETTTENFLVRIHQLISASTDKRWERPEIIESELLWLTALHRDIDIVV